MTLRSQEKTLVTLRFRPDIPYERKLFRLMQRAPHGYKKRFVAQLCRTVIGNDMGDDEALSTLIAIADNGIPGAGLGTATVQGGSVRQVRYASQASAEPDSMPLVAGSSLLHRG